MAWFIYSGLDEEQLHFSSPLVGITCSKGQSLSGAMLNLLRVCRFQSHRRGGPNTGNVPICARTVMSLCLLAASCSPNSSILEAIKRRAIRRLAQDEWLSFLTCTRAPGISTNPKRSEEHTSELQSRLHLVCRLLLEKKNN